LLKNLVTIIHVLFCFFLIAVVLLQSGRSAGLSGTIAGGADTLFGKKKGLDELLGKMTTVVAVLFGVTALVLGFWQ